MQIDFHYTATHVTARYAGCVQRKQQSLRIRLNTLTMQQPPALLDLAMACATSEWLQRMPCATYKIWTTMKTRLLGYLSTFSGSFGLRGAHWL